LKSCTRCRRTKPLTAFYRRGVGEKGVRGRCKSCDSQRMHLYYVANHDKIRAYQRAYLRGET